MDEVSERVRALGLHQEVIVYGERLEVAPWYAACDVVLLTSEFEGLPYVAFEAMAMATPLVGPDLPGLRELVADDTGVLVSPRDDVESYCAALAGLATDPGRRQAMGSLGRERVLREYSLDRMAREHESLYDELLVAPPDGSELEELQSNPNAGTRDVARTSLRGRSPRARPLVSVIIPCFNHGRYLPGCIDSVAAQTYGAVETIVVDNASTDLETVEVFAGLERDARVKVIRLETNYGPSRARNAAIEIAGGRYVLPLDADNLLFPTAVDCLVEQLSSAGEQIGFIYPNYQFFGNRHDYFEPPSYNLHRLLSANYCDTSSMLDKEIFDHGFRYPEDVVLGFEDWDLVLSLAERGIYGEPARTRTLLYRRHGFTRVDLVEAASVPFAETVSGRHPVLFQARAQVKAQWSPAVSIIALDALESDIDEPRENLIRAAARQTCDDFELVVRTVDEIWPTELGPRLRRLPRDLADSRAAALALGLDVARGRYVLALYGSAAAALADPAMIEKALRILHANPQVYALAFAEAGDPPASLRLLSAESVQQAQLSGLLWAPADPGVRPVPFDLPGPRPLETIARWLSAHRTVQWRHLPRPDRRQIASICAGPNARLRPKRHPRARDAQNLSEPPLLPGLPAGVGTRVTAGAWMPPQSRMLCRHLHHESGRYMFTNDRTPPPGCSLQYDLGCLRSLPFAGTISLVEREQEGQTEFTVREQVDLDAPELLGFVEQAPLPLFDALQAARVRRTGQRVLISGPGDPINELVEDVTFIGYIEPFPIHPRRPPHAEVTHGVLALIRNIDLVSRCHRYRASDVPLGENGQSLGMMFAEPMGDSVPLFIDEEGGVSSPLWRLPSGRPALRTAMRWTAAPIAWKGAGPMRPRIRASARRAYDSARILSVKPPSSKARRTDRIGFLLASPTDSCVALHAGIHPVTGDQLLSTDEREPGRLGYGEVTRLGYLFTDTQGPSVDKPRPSVPWASRFGRV